MHSPHALTIDHVHKCEFFSQGVILSLPYQPRLCCTGLGEIDYIFCYCAVFYVYSLKLALIRHCYVNRSSILHKSTTHSTFTHHRCCYYYFNWTKNDLTNGLSIHPSFTIHSIADRNLGRETPNYDDRWWLRAGTRQVQCPLCVFGLRTGEGVLL